MSADKNGYVLTRGWFDWCKINSERVAPAHTALYLLLVDINNRKGWPDKFGFNVRDCMSMIGIRSYNTFKTVFQDLVSWRFVTVERKSVNRYTDTIITLSKFDRVNIGNDELPYQNLTGQNQNLTGYVSKFDRVNTENDELTANSDTPKLIKPIIKHTAPAHKKFIPPTVDEVRAYCTERRNRVDPELFIDFYTANGWTQGHGKPIRDWRACVRTWEKRDNSFNHTKTAHNEPHERKIQPIGIR